MHTVSRRRQLILVCTKKYKNATARLQCSVSHGMARCTFACSQDFDAEGVARQQLLARKFQVEMELSRLEYKRWELEYERWNIEDHMVSVAPTGLNLTAKSPWVHWEVLQLNDPKFDFSHLYWSYNL